MDYKKSIKRFWAPIIVSITGVLLFGSTVYSLFNIGSDPNALNDLYVIVGASLGTLIIRQSLSELISNISIAGQILRKDNLKTWAIATIVLLIISYPLILILVDITNTSLDIRHYGLIVLMNAYLALPALFGPLNNVFKLLGKFVIGIFVSLVSVVILRYVFEGSIFSLSELFQVTGPIILGAIILSGIVALLKVLFTPTPEQIAPRDSGPSVPIDSKQGEEFLDALDHLTSEWVDDGTRGTIQLTIDGKVKDTYTIPERTVKEYQSIQRELRQGGDNYYREYPDGVDTDESLVVYRSESLDNDSLISKYKDKSLLRIHTLIKSIRGG
jgi:hypothetical protein